ncbi:unnamed protein product [Peniophora sp. CBMAI 1063]|nr:unnamed protein product [Peniophora sp. CBMAI 1063]
MAAPSRTAVHVDEDLDDLDDILEEFKPPAATAASVTVPPPSTKSPAASSSAPKPVAQPDPDAFNADFADEFAKQMEAALRELGGESGEAGPSSTAPASDKDKEQEEAFRKAWEKLLVDGMNGEGEGEGAPPAANAAEDPFQKNIREAMERLKQSDETLQANAASGGDDLEKLLASLGGDSTDEDLHGILEGMMGQLMSKDVLYDPLKELHEKFPAYMKENDAKLSKADKERYQAQIASITKIMAVFDDPAYKDEDPEKSAEIVALMSEMQTHGSPPEELMGPLPPGLNLGTDGIPKLPEDCQTQ